MDDLRTFLIIAGVVVIVGVWGISYYRKHRQIRHDINDFNRHADDIDDVLLSKPSRADEKSDRAENFTSERDPYAEFDEIISGPRSVSAATNSDDTDTSLDTSLTATRDERELPEDFTFSVSEDTSTPDTEPSTGYNTERVAEPPSQADDGLNSTATETPQPREQQALKFTSQRLPPGVDELIIAILIKSKETPFNGSDILNAVKECGMEYGDMDIFHFAHETDSGERVVLFSLANMVEPGTFDLNTLPDLQSPGLTLFQRFPCCTRGVEAYEQLIYTAQKLATILGGELLDETRSVLTQQTITHSKERIKQHQFAIDKALKKADQYG